jgi:hypothetical protein
MRLLNSLHYAGWVFPVHKKQSFVVFSAVFPGVEEGDGGVLPQRYIEVTSDLITIHRPGNLFGTRCALKDAPCLLPAKLQRAPTPGMAFKSAP